MYLIISGLHIIIILSGAILDTLDDATAFYVWQFGDSGIPESSAGNAPVRVRVPYK